jgi:hypothetical protein
MNCCVCDQEISPLRLKILPNTKTCVKCSDVAPKRARTVSLGEGDHTYNEIEIMDNETYRQVMKLEGTKFYEENEAPLSMTRLEDEEETPVMNFVDVLKKLEQEDDQADTPDVSKIEQTED